MNVSYTGFKELDTLLKEMPKQFQHNVIASAYRLSAKPLIESARTFINDKTGNLANSIGAQSVPNNKAESVGLTLVGPRFVRTGKVSKTAGGGLKGAHGYNVEYGHGFPYTGRKSKQQIYRNKSKRMGMVLPHPFMEPAYVQKKEVVVRNMQEAMIIRLNSLMNRILKKYS